MIVPPSRRPVRSQSRVGPMAANGVSIAMPRLLAPRRTFANFAATHDLSASFKLRRRRFSETT